jgi:hypothetical protein
MPPSNALQNKATIQKDALCIYCKYKTIVTAKQNVLAEQNITVSLSEENRAIERFSFERRWNKKLA